MGRIIKNHTKHHESMALAGKPDGKPPSFSPSNHMLVSRTKQASIWNPASIHHSVWAPDDQWRWASPFYKGVRSFQNSPPSSRLGVGFTYTHALLCGEMHPTNLLDTSSPLSLTSGPTGWAQLWSPASSLLKLISPLVPTSGDQVSFLPPRHQANALCE